jgi:hypothetical protein
MHTQSLKSTRAALIWGNVIFFIAFIFSLVPIFGSILPLIIIGPLDFLYGFWSLTETTGSFMIGFTELNISGWIVFYLWMTIVASAIGLTLDYQYYKGDPKRLRKLWVLPLVFIIFFQASLYVAQDSIDFDRTMCSFAVDGLYGAPRSTCERWAVVFNKKDSELTAEYCDDNVKVTKYSLSSGNYAECITYVAQKLNTPDLCSRIPNGESACILDYSIWKGGSSYCNSPKFNQSQRDDCFLSTNRGDLGQCQLIEAVNKKDRCFESVASRTSNSKICNYITGDRTRDFCFSEMARNTGDASLCEMISKGEKEYYDSCVRSTPAIAIDKCFTEYDFDKSKIDHVASEEEISGFKLWLPDNYKIVKAAPHRDDLKSDLIVDYYIVNDLGISAQIRLIDIEDDALRVDNLYSPALIYDTESQKWWFGRWFEQSKRLCDPNPSVFTRNGDFLYYATDAIDDDALEGYFRKKFTVILKEGRESTQYKYPGAIQFKLSGNINDTNYKDYERFEKEIMEIIYNLEISAD